MSIGKILGDLKDKTNFVPNLCVTNSLDSEEVGPVHTTNELLPHMFRHKIRHVF